MPLFCSALLSIIGALISLAFVFQEKYQKLMKANEKLEKQVLSMKVTKQHLSSYSCAFISNYAKALVPCLATNDPRL
jgi:hypothetical protein